MKVNVRAAALGKMLVSKSTVWAGHHDSWPRARGSKGFGGSCWGVMGDTVPSWIPTQGSQTNVLAQ